MSSSRSVTAASAAAVDQASSAGASGPLMSFRFSSAISVRSKPARSLARASRRTYDHSAAIRSSSTLRSHPPKTGNQYPKRISAVLLRLPGNRRGARRDRSRPRGVRRLARASERAGFDLTLIAELNLNDIKGPDAPALDAWSTAAALAAVTDPLAPQ